MADFRGIEQGFVDQVAALNLGLTTGHPNKDVADPPSDAIWLQQFNLPADTNPVTLGNLGEDANLGVYQIDVSTTRETGTGDILDIVDTIANAFPAGTKFAGGTSQIRVERTSRSPGRKAAGFYRISVSIEYSARTRRIAP